MESVYIGFAIWCTYTEMMRIWIIWTLLFLWLGLYPLWAMLVNIFSTKRHRDTVLKLTTLLLLTVVFLIFLHEFLNFLLIRSLYFVLWSILLASLVSYVYWTIIWVGWMAWYRQLIKRKQVWLICLVVWLCVWTYSILHFHGPISVKDITVESSKITEPITFVFFADTQFGSTTSSHLSRVIQKINAVSPDFVIFGGDRIDVNTYERDDFSALGQLQSPLYRVRWNHEYYHDVEKIDTIIESYSETTLLDSEIFAITEDIELVWIDYEDLEEKESYTALLDMLPVSENTLSIFVAHEPKFVADTMREFDYDIHLYWHTHGWQIFPWELFVKAVYGKFWLWLHRVWEKVAYTTHGAWVRWPNMRLGTRNEIVKVTIE